MRKVIKIGSILTILLTLFLFWGCAQKDIPNVPNSGSILDLPIGLTKSLSGHEIKKYRILVYSDGDLISNTVFTNTQDDIPTTRVKVAKGINNFYVFCNETTEMTTKIESATGEIDLDKITFTLPANAGINSAIPMYGKVSGALIEMYDSGVNVTVNGVTKTHLTMNVDRLMVKLSLTFIKNIVLPDEDFVIDELKINIHRMPEITAIKPDIPYTNSYWAQGLSLTGSGTITNNGEYTVTNGSYSIPGNVDNIKFRDIYIPEHILADAANSDQASYIAVDVTYQMKNDPGVQLRTAYIINLGQMPPTNYNLKRNDHIDIYATISKLGEGLLTSFNIIPWNDGGLIDVEEPDGMYFLNTSSTTVSYPHTIYIDKGSIFCKDADGNRITPLPYSYSCHFWTNRPSSTVSTTNFIMDEDPSKNIGITQSMTITEDNTVGDTHSVKGKIDINIPSEDVVQGFLKRYSMRLKSDLLDRKLTFAISDYDFIPEIIDPGFSTINNVVITGSGSTATSTTESFNVSMYLPIGTTPGFTFTPSSYMTATFKDITPAEADLFAPKLYEVTYKSSSPRNVTAGTKTLKLTIKSGLNTIYTAPFELSFSVVKP